MREISKEAGCGAGYLHDILKAGKDPTIERLMRIADALDVSLSWLLYDIEMSKQDEELLRLFATLSKRQKKAFLDLAMTMPALPDPSREDED